MSLGFKRDESIQPVTSVVVGETTKTVDDRALDEAAKYLANHEEFGLMTPEQEKKIVKKIDAWMIPLLLFCATLSAVDKVEIGTASLYGFQKDNGMVGQQYSWLGSILPLGILVGLLVTSYLIQRFPPGKLLAIGSLLWSICTLMYAPCRTWSGFMGLRFLLGFLEAVSVPCFTILVASFYKKEEQPPRNGIIFAYFSSIFNGFFAWVIGYIPEDAPLRKWQYLYLLTGSINVIYSIFLWFVLPESPMNAFFLTPEQRYHATQRLAANRTGIANRVWKWEQVWEALMDVKVWLIVLFNIVINIPNGGLQAFGSIIINNLGYSPLVSSLLTMPFGVLATGGSWCFSYIAAKWHNRRALTAALALLLPIFGTALAYGLPRTNVPGQMVGLYFMYFYWPPYVVAISLIQANTAGMTKKAVTYSLATIGYAAGNLIGPQTFRSNEAPKYATSVIAMLVSYCACILILMVYWLVGSWENKRRDRKYGKPEGVHEGTNEGFVDITDKKQREFRYTT
ncbi:MFS general substrate transporter [Daldinia decipiens]|uniref:MFS general substrate transporter n=1 Tax=Daldinia decipiens TaxID=326647 RepID=UPI0020C1F20C|nr:MFS general substrate transporter [Daldinia decipiens]KAI1657594.1 MFS general substrate transporter [Daldinia decipiens]